MYVRVKEHRCLDLTCYCYDVENEELKIKMKSITELYMVFLCHQNGHYS